jgi:hypothetical protein
MHPFERRVFKTDFPPFPAIMAFIHGMRFEPLELNLKQALLTQRATLDFLEVRVCLTLGFDDGAFQ